MKDPSNVINVLLFSKAKQTRCAMKGLFIQMKSHLSAANVKKPFLPKLTCLAMNLHTLVKSLSSVNIVQSVLRSSVIETGMLSLFI